MSISWDEPLTMSPWRSHVISFYPTGNKYTIYCPCWRPSANVWSKVALPSITYGSEFWTPNVTGMSELELAQNFAAKTIQSLGIRTHDEIAWGLLGWYPLESIIILKKLSYFERIVHQNTKFIPRRILLIRLFTYILERQNLWSSQIDERQTPKKCFI